MLCVCAYNHLTVKIRQVVFFGKKKNNTVVSIPPTRMNLWIDEREKLRQSNVFTALPLIVYKHAFSYQARALKSETAI